MSGKKDISVYAHWKELESPKFMGTLVATLSRGKEIFSFEYSKEWLQSGFNHTLDPDLQYFPGQYFPRDEKQNFGAFLDSCPDRWGRILMKRKEAVLARQEKRPEKNLFESDFLLGVFDEHRMGALRFKLSENENFLNDDKNRSAPPFTSLRELEHASKMFEEDNINDSEYLKWINLLIAPGSSLGGARPKASVKDEKNQLWIAKFPSINDEKNMGAWEMVANELALNAGLNAAEGDLKKFNSHHHTFLTKRFDRNEKSERIHFASAMTMLGYTDGASHDSGVSYLEIVEFLMRNGADVNADLEELWRRIVFSICIKNTDDHLRNHGFLLTENGWKLSPAYDLNPNENGTGLSLNISETDNSLDLDIALSVAEYFRVEKSNAGKIISKVNKSVSHWREAAKKYGIPKSEQDRMQRAFE